MRRASHVSSQSRTRVKLNRVFFVRFLVSPKFPNVPLGVGGWPTGYEEKKRLKVSTFIYRHLQGNPGQQRFTIEVAY